jgi:hypothetical protein
MTSAQLKFTPLFVGVTIFAATVVDIASAQSVRVTDDWVTLRPPGGGFHILMPPDWKQDTPRTPNGKLSFIAKQPPPSGRPGVTNCLVTVLPSPDTANYTQATIDAEVSKGVPPEMASKVASFLQNPSVRENRIVRVSNQLAYFIGFSGSYESLNAKVYAVAAAVTLIRPGQTYNVTCLAADTATPQRGEAAWNAWQPVFMTILSTFMIEDWSAH